MLPSRENRRIQMALARMSESPQPDMNFPDDLRAFLAAGKRLQYDVDDCEAGAIELVPLQDLKLERFPVETGPLPEQDKVTQSWYIDERSGVVYWDEESGGAVTKIVYVSNLRVRGK